MLRSHSAPGPVIWNPGVREAFSHYGPVTWREREKRPRYQAGSRRSLLQLCEPGCPDNTPQVSSLPGRTTGFGQSSGQARAYHVGTEIPPRLGLPLIAIPIGLRLTSSSPYTSSNLSSKNKSEAGSNVSQRWGVSLWCWFAFP